MSWCDFFLNFCMGSKNAMRTSPRGSKIVCTVVPAFPCRFYDRRRVLLQGIKYVERNCYDSASITIHASFCD
jgi:hypothetical protein